MSNKVEKEKEKEKEKKEVLAKVSAYKINPYDLFLRLKPNQPENKIIKDITIEEFDNGEKAEFVNLMDLDYKLVLGASYEEIVSIGSAACKEDATKEERERGEESPICQVKLINHRLTYGTYKLLYQFTCSLQERWLKESFLKAYALANLGGKPLAHVNIGGHRRSILIAMLLKETSFEFGGFPFVKPEQGSNQDDWVAEQAYGNQFQQEFSKLEIAEILLSFIQKGIDIEVAAAKLGITEPTARAYLDLRAAHPKVIQYILKGKISDSRVLSLMKEFPKDYVEVIEELLENVGGAITRSRTSTKAINRIREKKQYSALAPHVVDEARQTLSKFSIHDASARLVIQLEQTIKAHNKKISLLRDCVDSINHIDATSLHDPKQIKKLLDKGTIKELEHRGLFEGNIKDNLEKIRMELREDVEELEKI